LEADVKKKTKKSDEVEAGVRAIIDLQSVVGIKEPKQVARQNWLRFSAGEKAATMMFHQTIFPEKYAS
jgi:hypothetical protein